MVCALLVRGSVAGWAALDPPRACGGRVSGSYGCWPVSLPVAGAEAWAEVTIVMSSRKRTAVARVILIKDGSLESLDSDLLHPAGRQELVLLLTLPQSSPSASEGIIASTSGPVKAILEGEDPANDHTFARMGAAPQDLALAQILDYNPCITWRYSMGTDGIMYRGEKGSHEPG